ncbi:DNA topology modulation protein [Nostoc sp. CENA67]|uniref:DNA topology modulation protein n=1 Tax=Amazonocrinis nigriterrae CENA67 TaxID=2794033 RepID=A0A8J7HXP0_9NOST|nr:DNA topology modulation protein [Amazonocrinis nigriterrae]MBH8565262.1 DNA topology modulation protein [Amazonocrinis nigriterrae CENA67]
MKKIMIIGSGGAGKSTLARELGSILGLEVIHLDTLYWNPGWVETPKPEWQSIIQDLTLRESWIMDGNYSGTLDIRLAIADTVIFLDLKRLLCLWRVIKRSWQYAGQSRPDMASGCPERLTWEFLNFVWTYPSTRRPHILNKLSQLLPNQQVIILRKPKEVRKFLQHIFDY